MEFGDIDFAKRLMNEMLTITDPLEDTEPKVCRCDKCVELRKDVADEHNFIEGDFASKQFIRNVIDKGGYVYCFRVMRSVSLDLVKYLNEANSVVFFVADDPEEGVESSYFGIYEVMNGS